MSRASSARGLVAALFALAVSAGFLPTAARAQTAVTPGRALPVHFTATATPADPRPGEIVTVTVSAKIDAGWHLYAPASDSPAGTPTTVSDITAAYDWQPVTPTLDDTTPETKFDPNFQASVAYHEATAQLNARLQGRRAGTGSAFHHVRACRLVPLPDL